MHDVTFIIKAFERQEALDRCVQSVQEIFPGYPIVVADDSFEELTVPEGVEYLRLPYDSGLSVGRNALIDHATTDLVFLLDEDTVILEGADLDGMIYHLDSRGLDILAGEDVSNPAWHGLLVKPKSGDRITHLYGRKHKDGTCDFVLNFFLARRESLQRVRWDERLKICEHTEFFWRAKEVKLKVARTNHVRSANCRDRNEAFNAGRFRSREFSSIQHGILNVKRSEFINPDDIRAVITYNPNIEKHPMRSLVELRDRIALECNCIMIPEDQLTERHFQDKNLLIGYFSWTGFDLASEIGIRSVFITDDIHWRTDEHFEMTTHAMRCADLIMGPNMSLLNEVPEYADYAAKGRQLNYAVPWFFEPGPWAGRTPKAALPGGLNPDVYPLRTMVSELNPQCVSRREHPGYFSGAEEGSSYRKWLGEHQIGLATRGYAFDGKLDYALCKYLEVAAITCPMLEESWFLSGMGFKAWENYIPLPPSPEDAVDQIEGFLRQPDYLREIFLKSSGLIASKHTCGIRANEFWHTIKKEFSWL